MEEEEREERENTTSKDTKSHHKNKAFSEGVMGRLCIQLPAQQHAMCYSG